VATGLKGPVTTSSLVKDFAMKDLIVSWLLGAATFLATNFVISVFTHGLVSWWYMLCAILAGLASALYQTFRSDGGFVRLAVACCLAPFLLSVYLVVLLAVRDGYFGWWFAIFSPLQAIVDSAIGAALVVVVFRKEWFGSVESELAN